jgi:hypothetical protein
VRALVTGYDGDETVRAVWKVTRWDESLGLSEHEKKHGDIEKKGGCKVLSRVLTAV